MKARIMVALAVAGLLSGPVAEAGVLKNLFKRTNDTPEPVHLPRPDDSHKLAHHSRHPGKYLNPEWGSQAKQLLHETHPHFVPHYNR